MVRERPRQEMEGAPRAAMKSPAPRVRDARAESVAVVLTEEEEVTDKEGRTEPREEQEHGAALFLTRRSEEKEARAVAAQAGIREHDISVSCARFV